MLHVTHSGRQWQVKNIQMNVPMQSTGLRFATYTVYSCQ